MQKQLVGAAVALLMIPVLLLVLIVTLISGGDSSQQQQQPGPSGPGLGCGLGPPPAGAVAGFRGVQLANAAWIIAAGQEMQVPQRGWVIAVATAMQESSLTVEPHGDTVGPDSRGLFQQRTSWGPLNVRMDPKGSATLFYQRLVKLPSWQTLPLTVAAQHVQGSAFPNAYAKWEQPAATVVDAVQASVQCQAPSANNAPNQATAPNQPSMKGKTVVDRALSQVGVRYAWAGGNANGPSAGTGPDAGVVGFDCSGLALYAYAGVGVKLPHQTQTIADSYPLITDRTQVQPGDLLMISSTHSRSAIDHVAIYLGNGQAVDAPHSGSTVGVRTNIWAPDSPNAWYGQSFIAAVRPGG